MNNNICFPHFCCTSLCLQDIDEMYKARKTQPRSLRDVVSPDSFRYQSEATCMLEMLLHLDCVTLLYRKYDCHAKIEMSVFVSMI